MWIVCENHSLAVMPKANVSITVHLRERLGFNRT